MLSQWCYNHGFSLQEYYALSAELDNEATRLIDAASSLRKIGTGMYYPIDELIPPEIRANYEQHELLDFLLAALSKKGVEFYDSRSLYRI